MHERPGRFIVLEGPDGSGKSTMLDAVLRHLETRGLEVVPVHDPGGTQIGSELRELLLDPANANISPLAELLLYLASRAQLVEEVIYPALEEGKVVVADRFFLSTLVYQGVQNILPEMQLKDLVLGCVEDVFPDHTILLDLPAELGLERIGREYDRMELKGIEYMQRVRERYLGYAEGAPEGMVSVVDATQTLLEVKQDVLEILDGVLEPIA